MIDIYCALYIEKNENEKKKMKNIYWPKILKADRLICQLYDIYMNISYLQCIYDIFNFIVFCIKLKPNI